MTKVNDRVPGLQFTSSNPPLPGDLVTLNHPCPGPFEVERVETDFAGDAMLRFKNRPSGWCLYPTAGPSGCTLAQPVKVAKEPTAPMQRAVLDLLRRKGAITSMEAQGVLRCRQLPARVLELKRLGHQIVTEIKRDPTGQKYARYHLQSPVAGASDS